MNGKHRAPRKYTHIEKIRIMNRVDMAIAVYLLDAMFSIYLGVLRAVFVMPMWRKLEISSISLLFLSLCLFFFEFRRRKSEAHG